MGGRIIHTGQAIVDLVLRIDHLPEPGGDVFASSHVFTAGGGFNVMAAARREEAPVMYAGCHGTGPFGDIVRTAMSTEGIEIIHTPEQSMDSGVSIAFIDADAERTFVSTVGAECKLTVAHLNAGAPRPGDLVYVCGYSLYHPTNAAALMQWLPSLDRSIIVVFDASPMIAQVSEKALAVVAARADIWTANEAEARTLAHRMQLDSNRPPSELAQEIAEVLNATVLVRVSQAGCWLATPDTPPEHIAAFEVHAIDTNGAGDAHTGVLCAGLILGRSLRESAVRASAAAAISVTRNGPATAPTRAEIDELINN